MSKLLLKCRSQQGQYPITDLTSDSTLVELKMFVMSLTGYDLDRIQLKQGFPPTVVSADDGALLADCGIKTGDVIIAEELKNPPDVRKSCVPAQSSTPNVKRSSNTLDQSSHPVKLIKESRSVDRKVVPANNSCLFASIYYCIYGVVDQSKAYNLRKVVAEKVLSDTDQYSEAVLGRTPTQYAKWIKESESWGGAIELSILCKHLNVQIIVIDIQNVRTEVFGEGEEYKNKILLLYDGIHYDPLYQSGDSPLTIFPVTDEVIVTLALSYAEQQKSKRQFTDTNRFTVKCLACGQGFVGGVEATEHAKLTGHVNFGEC